jgi:hypothetical protein
MKNRMLLRQGVILLLVAASNLARADGGAAHQAAQSWPILLGTSGGNVNDRSTLYCCSGTLGALVQDGSGRQFILGNNHVLANVNQGQPGDAITQPGAIDQNCGTAGPVANLTTFVALQFGKGRTPPLNQVDCAIAQVVDGAVSSTILDIGGVSSETVAASLGLAVQKSGRTTGLTTGSVSATDATVDVGYSSTCGGAANLKARFVNQIIIGSGTFSAGGDSGSVIFEAGATPRAVGLLFAGSSSTTIANPIGAVLSALNVSMVGSSGGGGGGGGGSGATKSSVKSISYRTQGGKAQDKDLLITIVVVDDSDSPVSGAQVDISVDLNGSLLGTGTGATTDSTGAVTYQVRNAANGTYKTRVDNVIKAGLTFDGVTPDNSFTKSGAGSASFAGSSNAATAKAALERARVVKAQHSDALMEIDDVVGHALGRNEKGEAVIEIYLAKENANSRTRIPASLENVPVRVVITGPFMAR